MVWRHHACPTRHVNYVTSYHCNITIHQSDILSCHGGIMSQFNNAMSHHMTITLYCVVTKMSCYITTMCLASRFHIPCWDVFWILKRRCCIMGSPALYTQTCPLVHSSEENKNKIQLLPFWFTLQENKNKTSTTSSCSGPIPAQRSRANLVPGAIIYHLMFEMIFYYFHFVSLFFSLCLFRTLTR